MRHKIIRPNPENPVFKISWDNVPNSFISLDFAPLLSFLDRKLGDKFVLLHWQARPKGLRRWGLFDGLTNNYYSCEFDHVAIKTQEHKLVQIDENIIKTLPTAVIFYDNSIVDITMFPHVIITN